MIRGSRLGRLNYASAADLNSILGSTARPFPVAIGEKRTCQKWANVAIDPTVTWASFIVRTKVRSKAAAKQML